jgi:hypothetical protein
MDKWCRRKDKAQEIVFKTSACDFGANRSALKERIKELQEQQFTEEEAEKVETFLTHGYQMMINENKKIFSKLEKMKGEQ